MNTPIRFRCIGHSLCFLLFALWIVPARPLSATVVTWTDTSNGNWRLAANWNPNPVTSTNDTAVITNAGTYPLRSTSTPLSPVSFSVA
jgi:hypothetical protein